MKQAATPSHKPHINSSYPPIFHVYPHACQYILYAPHAHTQYLSESTIVYVTQILPHTTQAPYMHPIQSPYTPFHVLLLRPIHVHPIQRKYACFTHAHALHPLKLLTHREEPRTVLSEWHYFFNSTSRGLCFGVESSHYICVPYKSQNIHTLYLI